MYHSAPAFASKGEKPQYTTADRRTLSVSISEVGRVEEAKEVRLVLFTWIGYDWGYPGTVEVKQQTRAPLTDAAKRLMRVEDTELITSEGNT